MSGTPTGVDGGPAVLRFRHHRGRPVAGVVFLVSLFTLVAVSPWFGLLMLPPLAWTVWAWRAGTDADHGGVVVRALLGSRRLRWSEVDSLFADRSGRVLAGRRQGGALVLTAVSPGDLPALSRLPGSGPGAPAGGRAATGAPS